jgi:hypothetical protein
LLFYVCQNIGKYFLLKIEGLPGKFSLVNNFNCLDIFIIQIPIALSSIRISSSFELDFFCQGIEAKICFSPVGGNYHVLVVNYGDDKTKNEEIICSKEKIEAMLDNCLSVFMTSVALVFPKFKLNPMIQSWVNNENET